MRLILAVLDLPPVWLVAHVAAVWALAQVSPTLFGAVGHALGPALVALGLGVMLMAVWQMVRHRTTVIPRRNPSSLVTTGVFGWSRNPIYLADALVLAGAILWLDAVLALPLLVLFLWVILTRFIRDEEAHLTLAFGPEFDLWAARTRRWIGRRGTGTKMTTGV